MNTAKHLIVFDNLIQITAFIAVVHHQILRVLKISRLINGPE
jgi:hypothetical protein